MLVWANPKAGARSGGLLVENLTQLLRERGFSVDSPASVDELADQSLVAQRAGTLRAVVVAGGDGTVAMVANCTQPGVPIVVLPLGTENLVSKYLGITADPQLVGDIISDGLAIRLDAGRANDRIFLLMVGCGFDAEVVRRLHQDRRGHIHRLSYTKPILDSIRSYQYPELRVYCDVERGSDVKLGNVELGNVELGNADKSSPPEIAARWVFVVNLPPYAAGLSIVPDAIGTDGLLDVCTFKSGSLWHGLRYLGGLALGRHRSWRDCSVARTRRLRIESDAQVPYQLDGDPGGYLPLDIQILPERLTMVVPQSWAESHGFRPVGKAENR